MQRKFLSNLLLLVILNLIVKPVAILGVDATVQNRVGSEEYGLYFTLLNFTYLFNILLDLGINNFTTKNVAQFPGLMQKYVGKIAGLRLILFGVYTIFTIVLAYALGYTAAVIPILGILILQQFFIAMIAYFRSYLAGMLLFKQDAVLSILDRLLLVIIGGSMLYVTRNDNSFTIMHFVYIQFFCYLVSFLVGFTLIRKYVGQLKIEFHKPITLLIVRESIPYALLIVLMALFTRVDSVMLERLLDDGAKQAGYYAQGFRLIDAFFMFAMLFSNLLLPIFSRMIRFGEDVTNLFRNAAKMLVWGTIALAALCFWNSKEILDLIYNNDTMYSAPAFQLLILMFIAMCIVLIYGTYLTALGEMTALNTIAFFGLIVNIFFNFFMIPRYGVVGAAVSTLVTQFVVAISQVFIVKMHLKLRWRTLHVIAFVVYTCLVFFGVYLLKDYHMNLGVQIAYLAVLVFAFRVINIKLFKGILTRSKVEPEY